MITIVARITEDDTTTYAFRCESCLATDAGSCLPTIARFAREHTIRTGHATVVEMHEC